MLKKKGRLVVGKDVRLRQKLIGLFHNSAMGGHSGSQATYKRLQLVFYWKGMEREVRAFVRECTICQVCKYETNKPAGLLQPLPIPERIWSDLSMDFIEGLPKSQGKEVIMVVVDRLSKYAHFIGLSHPYTAKIVAELFLNNIVKLHGIPMSIVSDRDPVFVSHFWEELFKL